jgi:hypothetical protein
VSDDPGWTKEMLEKPNKDVYFAGSRKKSSVTNYGEIGRLQLNQYYSEG